MTEAPTVHHAGRRISVWVKKVPKSLENPFDMKVMVHIKIETPGTDSVVVALPACKAADLADILSDASEGLVLQEIMES